MNNYMDYYNFINNLNQNNYLNNISLKQNNSDIYDNFLKGNLFDNLYIPYKDYKPFRINVKNEKDYLMLEVQTYKFAAHELNLYLDVNPDDSSLIALRNKYYYLYKEALNNYESKFGPICLDDKYLDGTPWAWNTNNWPWEGNK